MLIKDKNVATHRAFEVQLFTQTSFAANVRNVLSSYSFRSNGAKVSLNLTKRASPLIFFSLGIP